MSKRNPIRVLLVDDHRTILAGLASLIGAEAPRMEVVGKALNGPEALLVAQGARPDVIVLDVDLGEENGLDLIPGLNQVCTARIVVLTSRTDCMVQRHAQALGASGFVLKQQPAEYLLAAIASAAAVQIGQKSHMVGIALPRTNGGLSDLT